MPARPRQNRTPDGAKKRWSAEDRAQRSGAPRSGAPLRGRTQRADDTGRAGNRAGRRADPAEQGGRDRRPDWYPGGRSADEAGARGGRGAGRPGRSDDRGDRRSNAGRGSGDDRPRRFEDRDDRPRRFEDRGDRPRRSAGGDDRPRRFGDLDDRPRRFEDRDDRSRGFEDRGDRPRRFEDRDDRPRRFGDRDDRARRVDEGDRPRRSDDRARSFEDRGDRRSGRDGDGARSFRDSGSDRGAREDRAPRRSDGDGAARPSRDDRGSRPPRDDRSSRDDRSPRREAGDRPFRAPRRDDRPVRSDRPSRFEGRPVRDDRGPRQDRGGSRDEHAPRWEAPEDVVLERLEGEVVTADEVAGSSFADLGLGPRIVDALTELGATAPFPIQAATIPVALTGRNVLGRGRTGSGKTIAFGAALVERLMRNWADSGRTGTGRRMGRPPRALIMAPTRELALQIDRTVQPIARAVGLYTTQIVGGVPQARQVGALAKGVDIVIGTPGRIEDLLEQGRLDLSAIEIAVLDEADHMAELGFLEPMQRLLARIPEDGQRLMFSATLDSAVAKLVEQFLPDPSVHEVAEPEGAGSADHRVLVIEPSTKLEVLTSLIGSAERVLVFARTRAFAEQLADDLDEAGVRTESLHGDLNQARRSRNLQRFSEGRVKALVATDVAARGIHVDDIDLVIHADAAEDYKTYLHRSGRTGRAGASGTVVTLIGSRRRRRFTELLDRAGVEAGFATVRPGEDPVAVLQA